MKARDRKKDARNLRQLMEVVASIDSVDECRRFFSDLCTPAELQSLADRWRVAQLLDRGVPYRQIYEQTGVSTATVTRVARALAHGQDGYRRVLARKDARKTGQRIDDDGDPASSSDQPQGRTRSTSRR